MFQNLVHTIKILKLLNYIDLKSGIRETLNLLTYADSSSDSPLPPKKNIYKHKCKKKVSPVKGSATLNSLKFRAGFLLA